MALCDRAKGFTIADLLHGLVSGAGAMIAMHAIEKKWITLGGDRCTCPPCEEIRRQLAGQAPPPEGLDFQRKS